MIMNQFTKDFKLTPGYITGLTQTDGSFSVGIVITITRSIYFVPSFNITADLDSKYVIDAIHKYFGCVTVAISLKNFTAIFQVTKVDDLLNIIIPHFILHPLFCAKLHAFNLFKLIVEDKFNTNKKSKEWKIKIVKMSLSMNSASLRTNERINEIYNVLGVPNGSELPLIENINKNIDTIITNNNISGIIDGDGSFWISFS